MKELVKERPSKNGVSKKPTEKVAQKNVQLPEMDIRKTTFFVEGDTPLIVNNFSEKAKKQMLDKQTKKATKGREAKNPEEQYMNSLYVFDDKKTTGFPAVGFKAAMVRAGKQLSIPMTDSRGRFHVMANEGDLVEIYGKHTMREDMVRLATGVADIRFRGEYKKWKAKLTITFNASVISEEQLANLIRYAGFSCGIGEWRPEKSNSGSFGLFHLTSKF